MRPRGGDVGRERAVDLAGNSGNGTPGGGAG
jgi:hypothetical protein